MNSVVTPILEVEDVSMRFGKFVALNKVTTTFEAGRLSAIIGPNGAGKSTFFNVVSGAFPPSSGRLKFQGRDITGLAQHEFARIGIGIVDVLEHHVLEGDAPGIGGARIGATGLDQFGDGIFLVDRHDFIAQRIIWRVQAHRQRHWQLIAQPIHRRIIA